MDGHSLKLQFAIHRTHSTQNEATECYLTGYSLGAAQTTFASQPDEEQEVFQFPKILMINPPGACAPRPPFLMKCWLTISTMAQVKFLVFSTKCFTLV